MSKTEYKYNYRNELIPKRYRWLKPGTLCRITGHNLEIFTVGLDGPFRFYIHGRFRWTVSVQRSGGGSSYRYAVDCQPVRSKKR